MQGLLIILSSYWFSVSTSRKSHNCHCQRAIFTWTSSFQIHHFYLLKINRKRHNSQKICTSGLELICCLFMLILCIIQQHKYINTINKHILPSSLPAWWWYCDGFCGCSKSCLTSCMYINASMFSTCGIFSFCSFMWFHLIQRSLSCRLQREAPWLISIAILIPNQKSDRIAWLPFVCSTPQIKIISLQRLHDELLLFGLVQLQSHCDLQVWRRRWSMLFPHHLWSSGVSADNSGCGVSHTVHFLSVNIVF